MVIDPYIIKQRPEPPVWAKLVAFFLILGAGFWFAREGINVYKLQNQDIYNGKIIFTSFQVTGSRLYYVFSNGNNILHEHSWVVITKLYNVGDIVKIYYDTNKKLSYLVDLVFPNALLFLSISLVCSFLGILGLVKMFTLPKNKKNGK
jgi:hypothetical protein